MSPLSCPAVFCFAGGFCKSEKIRLCSCRMFDLNESLFCLPEAELIKGLLLLGA